MGRLATAIAVAVVIIGVTNFLAACVGSAMIGGDALNGYVQNGHYYVGSHGKYKEVTRRQWWFSACHTATIFPSHALAMAAMFLLLIKSGVKLRLPFLMQKSELHKKPGKPVV